MAYLVLARKYRSATFEEVVGQEPIARTLSAAIAAGRIAQAYLFTGTRGVGKTTMARILAKALNCLSAEAPTATPCGKCDACQAIARGEDMDVLEIDGASNRGIDDIRSLRASAGLHPARCRYRIYYIDEVHQVTRDAFNALLKTLEEPPPHLKFIFATTEPEKIPATILSRCQRYDFRNIPTRQIAGHLKNICQSEKVPAEEAALFRLARAGAGSMRDALSLLDQVLAACEKVSDEEVVRILGVLPEERVAEIVRSIAEKRSAGVLAELSAVLEAGVAPAALVAAVGDYFRNLMIASTCGATSDLIELPDTQRQTVGDLAAKFSTPALVQAVGILQKLAYTVRSSALARAMIEAAVVRLAEADKFVDPQSLLERLEGMGGAGVGGAPGKGGPGGGASAKKASGSPVGASAARAVGPAAVPSSPRYRAGAPGALPAPSAASPRPATKPTSAATAAAPRAESAAPAPDSRARTADQLKALSTAERQELQNDPTVRAALNLFGGEIVDMRKDLPPEEDTGNGAGGS